MPLWPAFAATSAAFALGALFAHGGGLRAVACGVLTLGFATLASMQIARSIARPLRTAASVLDAVRHGDNTLRASVQMARGPVADILVEVNALAAHLAMERTRAKEASELLQSVVQRIDAALLTFDDAGGLLWWNPASGRLFGGRLVTGITAEELGVTDWLAGPPKRRVTVPDDATRSAWEMQRGVFYRERHAYQFVLLASLRRVRREEERAAWQRLLRVIGHEVNNTLAPISSLASTCSQMLREDGGAACEDVLRALDVIEHRSAALGRFIAEYARLAGLPKPQPAPILLAEHLRRLVAMETRAPIEVLGQRDVAVLADAFLLEQALVNVLRNAVDAALVTGGAVSVDWFVEGEEVVVIIVDEGPGIENPDNLFVPLFSTKPGGSGIGLVLARNILEAHGGDIRLANRAQAPGCIARISIPLGRSASEA